MEVLHCQAPHEQRDVTTGYLQFVQYVTWLEAHKWYRSPTAISSAHSSLAHLDDGAGAGGPTVAIRSNEIPKAHMQQNLCNIHWIKKVCADFRSGLLGLSVLLEGCLATLLPILLPDADKVLDELRQQLNQLHRHHTSQVGGTPRGGGQQSALKNGELFLRWMVDYVVPAHGDNVLGILPSPGELASGSYAATSALLFTLFDLIVIRERCKLLPQFTDWLVGLMNTYRIPGPQHHHSHQGGNGGGGGDVSALVLEDLGEVLGTGVVWLCAFHNATVADDTSSGGGGSSANTLSLATAFKFPREERQVLSNSSLVYSLLEAYRIPTFFESVVSLARNPNNHFLFLQTFTIFHRLVLSSNPQGEGGVVRLAPECLPLFADASRGEQQHIINSPEPTFPQRTQSPGAAANQLERYQPSQQQHSPSMEVVPMSPSPLRATPLVVHNHTQHQQPGGVMGSLQRANEANQQQPLVFSPTSVLQRAELPDSHQQQQQPQPMLTPISQRRTVTPSRQATVEVKANQQRPRSPRAGAGTTTPQRRGPSGVTTSARPLSTYEKVLASKLTNTTSAKGIVSTKKIKAGPAQPSSTQPTTTGRQADSPKRLGEPVSAAARQPAQRRPQEDTTPRRRQQIIQEPVLEEDAVAYEGRIIAQVADRGMTLVPTTLRVLASAQCIDFSYSAPEVANHSSRGGRHHLDADTPHFSFHLRLEKVKKVKLNAITGTTSGGGSGGGGGGMSSVIFHVRGLLPDAPMPYATTQDPVLTVMLPYVDDAVSLAAEVQQLQEELGLGRRQ